MSSLRAARRDSPRRRSGRGPRGLQAERFPSAPPPSPPPPTTGRPFSRHGVTQPGRTPGGSPGRGERELRAPAVTQSNGIAPAPLAYYPPAAAPCALAHVKPAAHRPHLASAEPPTCRRRGGGGTGSRGWRPPPPRPPRRPPPPPPPNLVPSIVARCQKWSFASHDASAGFLAADDAPREGFPGSTAGI